MSREVRTFAEGALRWVKSSGTGGWTTASAAATALVGFVQAGTNFASAQTVVTVTERGTPHHHKITEVTPVELTFNYLQALTAHIALPITGAYGVSTPLVHFEIKSTDTENPSITGMYWQMINCVLLSRIWTEGVDGNQLQETWRALSMNGPTASGYLA